MKILDGLEDVRAEAAEVLAALGGHSNLVYLEAAALDVYREVRSAVIVVACQAEFIFGPVAARLAEFCESDCAGTVFERDAQTGLAVALGPNGSDETLTADYVLRPLEDTAPALGGINAL